MRLRHLLFSITLAACSSDDSKPAPGGSEEAAGESDRAGDSDEEASGARDAGKPDASRRNDAGKPDAARPSDDPPKSDDAEGCGGISAQAEAKLQPVDIVWAIDTSGSMTASFPAIQRALTSFSSRVAAAGIDARIALLAGSGLCVPAPVGSGACGLGGLGGGGGIGLGIAPDSKSPSFLHLDIPFGYGAGMGVILNNYGLYRDMLRTEARKHFVLTEDGPPPMSADAVIDHIQGSRPIAGYTPWTPQLAPDSYVFHGVICKGGGGGGACALTFMAPATTLTLIDRTRGVSADLALAGSAMDPFAALLDELAARVIVGAELSCEYDIPPVPNGETFDRGLVNVKVSSASSAERTLPQAKAGDCADNQAWSYDDDADPKKIVLCPKACDTLHAETEAKLDVQFGCATVILL